MGGDHRQRTVELALENLEVGVAEACGMDTDEQFIWPDRGDGHGQERVGSVILLI